MFSRGKIYVLPWETKSKKWKMLKNDKKDWRNKLDWKSKVFLKISPRGSKLPQGPFLLLKNKVMKNHFLKIYSFDKKYAKEIRSKIPRRFVVLMCQIDRKSYELWSKEFLSKNDFLKQKLIFSFKNKIPKLKHLSFLSNIYFLT